MTTTATATAALGVVVVATTIHLGLSCLANRVSSYNDHYTLYIYISLYIYLVLCLSSEGLGLKASTVL